MTTVTYLPSAPKDLLTAHQERQVGKGYKQLEVLVTHPDMERAWPEITKRAKPGDTAYGMRLFSEIVSILHHLKTRQVTLRRSEERSSLLTIAKQAEKLAQSVEEGPFDKLAYEYFPAEVMRINGIADWSLQDSLSRAALAHDLLQEWASFPEMLRELAAHVEKQANDAMTNPRLIERQRDRKAYRQRYFVRALADYFVKEYGLPLYGTTAYITNAILGTVLTKDEVEKLNRGPNKPQ